MISNRIVPCVLLLVVLQPTSSAMRVHGSGEEPIKGPSVIVIRVVSRTSDLIRPDKLAANSRTLPNGNEIAELPKPSEYYVGTIYKVRINEIIKGNKIVRAGQIITILIPGPRNVTHTVTLSAERKYLIQLQSLTNVEKYEGTVVMDLAQSSEAKHPFDSHDVFTLISDVNTAVPVTEDNKELIKRIRREAKR